VVVVAAKVLLFRVLRDNLEVAFQYQFEWWDPVKARQNAKKHRITFERGATIFLDPNVLSLFDEQHSRDEERWITPRFGSHRYVAGYLSHLSGRNGNKCKSALDFGAESYKERNEAISEEISYETRI
jgi:ribonuclease toxin BrnT of type II toxin-antitoxin system